MTFLRVRSTRVLLSSDSLSPSGSVSRRLWSVKSIIAEDLVKHYRNGEVKALDGLSLEVEEGTVLSLLGPNGAGKTTTVRILSTLLKPDSGRATVAGIDLLADPAKVRSTIGLSGQYAAVDETLTGWDNLVMFGRLYHLSNAAAQARATELLEQFSLSDDARRPIKTFSGGMRRRLDLAASLIIKPRVLFLDEPTTGLDPRGRQEMWGVIEGLVSEGVTLLLTTQYLEEADQLADKIAVVDHGRVIAEGTSDELKARIGGERVEVIVAESDIARARELMRRVSGAEPMLDQGLRKLSALAPEGSQTLLALVRELDAEKIHPLDLALKRPSLDDVFLSLTGHAAEDAAEASAETARKAKRNKKNENSEKEASK